jgi:hypothetical protein
MRLALISATSLFPWQLVIYVANNLHITVLLRDCETHFFHQCSWTSN